jgi:hypothetical protein
VITEAALAAQVVSWLEGCGGDVYQEVTVPGVLARRADIVSVASGGVVTVVECKLGLSWELLEQARAWTRHANMIWLAVPWAQMTNGRREAIRVVRTFYGFGLLEVEAGIVERLSPMHRARASDDLLNALRPEHKTHAKAGTNRGGHVTTYAITVETLGKFVAENPGCSLVEAFAGGVKHHYRSDDQAEERLQKAIKQGLVEGVFSGWKGRLWPTAEAARRGGTAA